MRTRMSELEERIVSLYFESNSAQFGAFRLSVHIDDPSLELSPFYLHYPPTGAPGSERLPELFEAIGDGFYDLAQRQQLAPRRVAGLPNGALPLGDELAQHYPEYPDNLVTFRKISLPQGTIIEPPNPETFEPGDELLFADDHTSGGRNKLIALRAARKTGFVVRHMLTAVDREQGATATLAEQDITLSSLLTISRFLELAVAGGFATQEQVDEFSAYRARNQFKLG